MEPSNCRQIVNLLLGYRDHSPGLVSGNVIAIQNLQLKTIRNNKGLIADNLLSD